MADEVHSPAKKRRKTDKTGLDQKKKTETQQPSARETGKIKKITSICIIPWLISDNSHSKQSPKCRKCMVYPQIFCFMFVTRRWNLITKNVLPRYLVCSQSLALMSLILLFFYSSQWQRYQEEAERNIQNRTTSRLFRLLGVLQEAKQCESLW